MPNIQMPSQYAYFRGDADGLVDMLVAASQAHRSTSATPCQERELQPWCPDDMASSPMFNQPLEAPRSSKHGRSPDLKYNISNSHSAAAAKRAKAVSSPARRCSTDAAQGIFACPSFAAAPKPEALPMPTTSLLTRALYRRSPSPPKAMNAMAVCA